MLNEKKMTKKTTKKMTEASASVSLILATALRYAHIRIELEGVGMEADMGHFINCILCFHSRGVCISHKVAEFDRI